MKVYIAYGEPECVGHDYDEIKKVFSTPEKAEAYMTEMNTKMGRNFISYILIMEVE